MSDEARASLLSFFGGVDSQAQGNEHVAYQPEDVPTLLRAARNIDPNPSRGGGDVTLVDGSALQADIAPGGTSESTVVASRAPDQIFVHVVDEGESVSKIAEMFDVSVKTIVWANELSSDTDIQPGDKLLILPISGVQHTVASGDTLRSVAKKYAGDIDDFDSYFAEFLAFNGLSADSALSVGTVVTIPGGEVEQPKQSSTAGTAHTAATTKVITSGPSVSGYFGHPVPGGTRTQGIHGYNGVDYGAPAGTPIYAAAAGTVIVSKSGGWNGGYGNYVVIRHANGTQTLYAHMTTVYAGQGAYVAQGEKIGTVGSTGRSTGNHLHFEVRGARNPF